MKSRLEYAPMILLCLYTTKLLINNNWSYENGLVLLALAAVTSIFHVKSKNDELLEVNKQLEIQKNELEDLKKQLDSVKANISGMKLASSTKNAVRF